MIKFKEYTDKLDYLVVPRNLFRRISRVDFSGGDVYRIARKLGLIDGKDTAYTREGKHRQVIDLSLVLHRKLHLVLFIDQFWCYSSDSRRCWNLFQ